MSRTTIRTGRDELRGGAPVPVRVHDFIDKELGKAIPYGVYDVGLNNAWVSVGVDHDTAEFAVESIARWWRHMGKKAYPDATELLITADGGGATATDPGCGRSSFNDSPIARV